MQIVCREGEPPAYTCAAVIDAVLATVGPDRPIELLEVGRLCRTRNPCEAMATVIVEVTFAPPDERLVRLIVNPGPDGPVAYFIEPEPGSTKPPQIGPTSEPREQRFNLAYGTEPPAGELTPIYEVELSDDRETLTVIFYGGGGYAGSPCGESDYEPWIGLEGNDLIVGIYVVDRPNRTFPPAPSGLVHACIMVAYPHTYYLTLAGGFAGTKVRDLKSQTFEVDAP